MKRLMVLGLLAVGLMIGLAACNPLTQIDQVVAGGAFSCALHSDGTVT